MPILPTFADKKGKMKLTLSILALSLATTTELFGQERDSVSLKGIVVKGARSLVKGNETRFYPTQQQKEASTNGYNLLARIAPQGLRIDEVAHTITPLGDKGDVQVRINGIVCGREELMSLDPNTVQRIEYTDSPSLRYGQDIGYVLNIYTHRNDAGCAFGFDTGNSVTTTAGNDFVFGRLNSGKSELGLSYTYGYKNFDGTLIDEKAHYLQADGTVRDINRQDIESKQREQDHAVQLLYNVADSSRYTFQAKLEGSLSRTPKSYNLKQITDGEKSYTAMRNTTYRTLSPIIDLYLQAFLSSRQTLTMNVVGTYINTKNRKNYDEGSPYSYDAKGKSISLFNEAIYKNKLKAFALTAGIRFYTKLTDNEYTGDATAHNIIHSNNVYAFSEIRGNLGRIGYRLGTGYSFLHFRQGSHQYSYNTFRPKVSLQYALGNGTHISYSFETYQYVSQIAQTSDVALRTNSMEWTVGNPDLHPTQRTEHNLRLNHNAMHLQTSLNLFWRHNHCPNMEKYLPATDTNGNTYYIYTQSNQRSIDMLYATNYTNFDICPERLSISYNAGIYHFINRGDDYTYHYTSFNGSVSLTAYLGNFTLSANADNGWNYMEGEHKGHTAHAIYLSASYKTGDFTLSAYYQYPLIKNPIMSRTEILSRYVSKDVTMHSRDFGNMITIGVAWNFKHGRQYKSIERKTSHEDKDSGIIK